MKHLGLIALLAITGCSSNSNTPEQNDTTVDKIDPADPVNGVVLVASEKMFVTFDDITRIYQETMACVGLSAVGPTVRFVDIPTFWQYEDLTVSGGWGVYDPTGSYTKYYGDTYYGEEQELTPNSILVNNRDVIAGTVRDNRTDSEVLQHEFVHHILNANSLDWSHNNPLFEQCGVGVNTYN